MTTMQITLTLIPIFLLGVCIGVLISTCLFPLLFDSSPEKYQQAGNDSTYEEDQKDLFDPE